MDSEIGEGRVPVRERLRTAQGHIKTMPSRPHFLRNLLFALIAIGAGVFLVYQLIPGSRPTIDAATDKAIEMKDDAVGSIREMGRDKEPAPTSPN